MPIEISKSKIKSILFTTGAGGSSLVENFEAEIVS
jgi:hypothetical protein